MAPARTCRWRPSTVTTVALGRAAEQLAAGADEVAGVGLPLEAEEVGAEEALEQLGAPRQLREELDRRERDVVEPADAHVGPQLAHAGPGTSWSW